MVGSWFRKLFWPGSEKCGSNPQILRQWHEIRVLQDSKTTSAFCKKTFAWFGTRRIIQSWFQKLFWNQCCDVVQNLPGIFAFSNFYVFHSTLISIMINWMDYTGKASDHLLHFWSNISCLYAPAAMELLLILSSTSLSRWSAESVSSKA